MSLGSGISALHTLVHTPPLDLRRVLVAVAPPLDLRRVQGAGLVRRLSLAVRAQLALGVPLL